MSSEALLQALRQAVIDGAPATARDTALQLLQAGADPLSAINDACVPAMHHVGERFACHDMYLPDMLAASEAMKAAMSVLEPELLRRGTQRKMLGKVLLGTVQGDIHEIGKSLVGILLVAAGFEVVDLGTGVSAGQFAAEAIGRNADMVGVSALLTHTMQQQRLVVEALEKNGLRSRVKVMVGGAPVTRKWAEEIGADGYGRDASAAVALARELLGVKPS